MREKETTASTKLLEAKEQSCSIQGADPEEEEEDMRQLEAGETTESTRMEESKQDRQTAAWPVREPRRDAISPVSETEAQREPHHARSPGRSITQAGHTQTDGRRHAKEDAGV